MPVQPTKIVREDFFFPRLPDNMRDSGQVEDFLKNLLDVLVQMQREITTALNQYYFNRFGDSFQGVLAFQSGEGEVRLPVYNGDPAVTVAGEIWYNSATNTFRRNRNGTVENW
jgi:hypothetical protein